MHSADLDAARAGVASYCRRLPSVGATANQILSQIFPPQHSFPKDYFKLSDDEAKVVDDEIERHVKAREFKITAFSDFITGHDMGSLRIPRPDAGRYTAAFRSELMFIRGASPDPVFQKAAIESLVTNLYLDMHGQFDVRDEDRETLQ